MKIETTIELIKELLNKIDHEDKEIWIQTDDTILFKRIIGINEDEYGINIECIDAEKWLGDNNEYNTRNE